MSVASTIIPSATAGELTLDNVERNPVLALGVLVRMHGRITLDADKCPASVMWLATAQSGRVVHRPSPDRDIWTHPFCKFWMKSRLGPSVAKAVTRKKLTF